MERESSNPISIQSKEWIVEALLELMKEKLYSEITITEISNKSQLARRTFYRNFDSKEDVLNLYIQKLVREYIEDLSREERLKVYDVAKVYFTFWREHLDFLILMEKSDLLYMILQKYNEYLPMIHEKVKGNNFDETKEKLEYVLTFSAGGFWNMLIKWVNGGGDKTPEEMARLVDMIMSDRIL